MTHRNRARAAGQHRRRIKQQSQELTAVDFFNVLNGPMFLETVDALLPDHRERIYTPTVALSMFIRQTLEEDGSLQKAVDDWSIQRVVDGLPAGSANTAAYCKARARLPLETLQGLMRYLAQELCTRAPADWSWRGRAVKLVDGTGISMPDTPDNQARYPQPSSQANGVGFPQAKLVGVVCLNTGALLDVAMGPHVGKRTGELSLFQTLLHTLHAGDVLLGDALYCSYFVVATLQAQDVDMVMEQNGSRITDFRRGERLGARDHRVDWDKPKRPAWMTQQQYQAFPAQLTLREVDVGGKILVTTLIDQREVHKNELQCLYDQRWHVELDLRNIKTTLGMDVLSCKTPEMVEKETWVYLLAYNMIRLLMAQAAYEVGKRPRQLSFKHAVQSWLAWITRAPSPPSPPYQAQLIALIAQVTVGARPGRIEPRARKRRPKPYSWLKEPRHEARERIRRRLHRPNKRKVAEA
jgi:hypothetical protein